MTIADRESERAILHVIRDAFPDASVIAEESGTIDGDPNLRWIVDPLDGTRGFTRGGKFWGPLIALEHDGEVIAGAMGLPALGDVYWAGRGQGCYKNGDRCRVSVVDDWSDSTMSVGELGKLLDTPHGAAVACLIWTAASTRGYGDPAGCAMVLDGRAEVWLEAGVKVWDLAPQKILIEEAGGVFTSFAGTGSIETGSAIAGNAAAHAHCLAIMKKALEPPKRAPSEGSATVR